MNQLIRNKTRQDFLKLFNDEPLLVRSPGRVNIIGEHTDYNEGFVLPAAIDMSVCVAITRRKDEQVKLFSGEFNQAFETDLNNIAPSALSWPNYILGVLMQLKKRRYPVTGFNLVVDGDVPIGSGMSSSAAVECATAFALNHLFELGIDKKDLALIAQKAEHEFAGVMCGIMDQFASVFGKKDHVIRLDCRSLEFEYVPFSLNGFVLLLLNTNVKHSLASSAYNTRREECEQGVRWLREKYPHVKSLRDADTKMVDEVLGEKDPLIHKRCQYVVSENDRLLKGCEDLRKGDLAALGKKMFQTHDGLSLQYEVSCPELDFLVDAVRNDQNVLGSRMMGGGFGGCTINLVKEEAVEKLVQHLSFIYKREMGRELTPYIAKIENGSEIVN